MSEYPTKLRTNVLGLPAEIDQTELNSKGLSVVQGLDESLAKQLVAASTQAHIAEYCPNDPIKRFGSVEQVVSWQSKGRLALPLVKSTGKNALNLVGFGWMGPGKPGEDEPVIPGAETTFAIRIYEEAVGQGNALPYTRTILQANQMLFGNSGVWLEAWGDNMQALKTYERAGFQTVAEAQGLRNGQEFPRVYMTLREIAPK